MKLSKLVSSLLAGSSITPETHPSLVSLLELAAARPDPPLEDSPKIRRQFHRQWLIVARVWLRLLAYSPTDSQIREFGNVAGLRLQASRWLFAGDPLEVRPAVAASLGRVCAQLRAIQGGAEPVRGAACPFCRDSGRLLLTGGAGGMHVECRACGATGPACPTVEKALEAWAAPVTAQSR